MGIGQDHSACPEDRSLCLNHDDFKDALVPAAAAHFAPATCFAFACRTRCWRRQVAPSPVWEFSQALQFSVGAWFRVGLFHLVLPNLIPSRRLLTFSTPTSLSRPFGNDHLPQTAESHETFIPLSRRRSHHLSFVTPSEPSNHDFHRASRLHNDFIFPAS